MKAITLLVILSTPLASALPGSLLMAAEPAPGRDQPAVITPPAKAAQPNQSDDQSDDQSNNARAVAGVDDAEAAVGARAAQSRAAPEKTPASASEEPGLRESAADQASPQRFVPSEQVRADFDVSFPIDM